MKKIIKKVQPEYFEAIVDGRKKFEVRLADFDCEAGDVLVLQEQQAGAGDLTGRETECEVLYKLNTKALEDFYSKEDIEKYGLVVLAVRKKFDFKNNK